MAGKPIWTPERCLRCGLCVGVCPQGALRLHLPGISIDADRCVSCLRCIGSCPSGSFGGG